MTMASRDVGVLAVQDLWVLRSRFYSCSRRPSFHLWPSLLSKHLGYKPGISEQQQEIWKSRTSTEAWVRPDTPNDLIVTQKLTEICTGWTGCYSESLEFDTVVDQSLSFLKMIINRKMRQGLVGYSYLIMLDRIKWQKNTTRFGMTTFGRRL